MPSRTPPHQESRAREALATPAGGGPVLERERDLARRLGKRRFPSLSTTRARALAQAAGAADPRGVLSHAQYGAAILGPALTTFAEWVVADCERRGLRTVHCLMREGHLLAPLVDAAARARKVNVTARPLWTSRYALRLASFAGPRDPNVLAYFRQRHPVTLELAARDFSLPIEVLASATGLARSAPIQGARAEHVTRAIEANEELDGAFRAAVSQRRQALAAYLRTAGLCDVPTATVVDVGWAGTIQRSLVQVLAEEGHSTFIHGLYLGASNGIDALPKDRASAQGFLFHGSAPTFIFHPLQRTPELVENACPPRVGSLRGFRADGTPEHFPVALPRRQLDEIDAIQRGIRCFAEAWFSDPDRPEPEEVLDEVRCVVARSLAHPTLEEVRLFAHWEHETNDGTTASEPLLGDAELQARARTMTHRAITELPWFTLFWPEGLATLVGKEPSPSLGDKLLGGLQELRARVSRWRGLAGDA